MQSGRDIPSLQKMVFSYMSQKGLLMVLLHSSQTASFFINVRITAPVKEGALRWDSCGIDWPFFGDPVLSEKDANAPALADLDSPFIFGQNS